MVASHRCRRCPIWATYATWVRRNFIANFLTRLNFLSLAKIAVAVAGSLPDPADAVSFLENEVRPLLDVRQVS